MAAAPLPPSFTPLVRSPILLTGTSFHPEKRKEMIPTQCCSRRNKDVTMEEEDESGTWGGDKKLETLIFYSFLPTQIMKSCGAAARPGSAGAFFFF